MPDLFNWLLVFLRASAMLSVFPVFSVAQVPRQARIALGAILSFLIAPMVPGHSTVGLDLWGAIGLMISETAFGVGLGFVSRMFLYTLEIAGVIIGMQMGLTMPGGLNPFTNLANSEVGNVLQYLGMALLLSMNMHHGLIVAFQKSYQFLPIGGGHLSEALITDLFHRTSQLFWFALEMSAPALAVSFLITLIFSVLSRAVPQMNVFSENFSVRLIAGFVVFGLTTQLMAEHIANYLHRLPEDILRVAQIMGGA